MVVSANHILIYCSWYNKIYAIYHINLFCNVNILSKWRYKMIAQKHKMLQDIKLHNVLHCVL